MSLRKVCAECSIPSGVWTVGRLKVHAYDCCAHGRKLVILFDQSNRAVDQIDIILAKVLADLGEDEVRSSRGTLISVMISVAGFLRVFLLIDFAMVVRGIDAHLVGVRPIELAVGREVVVGVAVEGLRLVGSCAR